MRAPSSPTSIRIDFEAPDTGDHDASPEHAVPKFAGALVKERDRGSQIEQRAGRNREGKEERIRHAEHGLTESLHISAEPARSAGRAEPLTTRANELVSPPAVDHEPLIAAVLDLVGTTFKIWIVGRSEIIGEAEPSGCHPAEVIDPVKSISRDHRIPIVQICSLPCCNHDPSLFMISIGKQRRSPLADGAMTVARGNAVLSDPSIEVFSSESH
jgi:hypothetical protein